MNYLSAIKTGTPVDFSWIKGDPKVTTLLLVAGVFIVLAFYVLQKPDPKDPKNGKRRKKD